MKFALRHDIIRRKWPPKGGWIYHEAATGWTAPSPMSDNFDGTVDRITRHRLANRAHNLSVDRLDIELELMDQTAKRIIQETPEHAAAWVVSIDEEGKKKLDLILRSSLPAHPKDAPPAAHALGDRGGMARRVLAMANGAKTLARWIGEGHQPVDSKLANHRSGVCETCPFNIPGDWFDRVTGAIADMVREEVTAKSAMDLRVQNEDKLGTCHACGCNLRLKVWVPLSVIMGRTSKEEFEELSPNCWIRHGQ
jgi:hypothetical protein